MLSGAASQCVTTEQPRGGDLYTLRENADESLSRRGVLPRCAAKKTFYRRFGYAIGAGAVAVALPMLALVACKSFTGQAAMSAHSCGSSVSNPGGRQNRTPCVRENVRSIRGTPASVVIHTTKACSPLGMSRLTARRTCTLAKLSHCRPHVVTQGAPPSPTPLSWRRTTTLKCFSRAHVAVITE